MIKDKEDLRKSLISYNGRSDCCAVIAYVVFQRDARNPFLIAEIVDEKTAELSLPIYQELSWAKLKYVYRSVEGNLEAHLPNAFIQNNQQLWIPSARLQLNSNINLVDELLYFNMAPIFIRIGHALDKNKYDKALEIIADAKFIFSRLDKMYLKDKQLESLNQYYNYVSDFLANIEGEIESCKSRNCCHGSMLPAVVKCGLYFFGTLKVLSSAINMSAAAAGSLSYRLFILEFAVNTVGAVSTRFIKIIKADRELKRKLFASGSTVVLQRPNGSDNPSQLTNRWIAGFAWTAYVISFPGALFDVNVAAKGSVKFYADLPLSDDVRNYLSAYDNLAKGGVCLLCASAFISSVVFNWMGIKNDTNVFIKRFIDPKISKLRRALVSILALVSAVASVMLFWGLSPPTSVYGGICAGGKFSLTFFSQTVALLNQFTKSCDKKHAWRRFRLFAVKDFSCKNKQQSFWSFILLIVISSLLVDNVITAGICGANVYGFFPQHQQKDDWSSDMLFGFSVAAASSCALFLLASYHVFCNQPARMRIAKHIEKLNNKELIRDYLASESVAKDDSESTYLIVGPDNLSAGY